MAYETYTPLFHEICTKVNNAKDKGAKIKVLTQRALCSQRGGNPDFGKNLRKKPVLLCVQNIVTFGVFGVA